MMKNILKLVLTLFFASSAFLVGFYVGQEKIISKIPKFQDDAEERP